MSVSNRKRAAYQTALATIFLVSGFSTTSLAQTAPTATEVSPDAEIVIVTARKREETVQDVPLSVTAFSARQIEARGLTSIADVATQTPGFSFRSGFGRTFDRPVIRTQLSLLMVSSSTDQSRATALTT
jgi:iron complex outermembrane recepter protein